MNLSKFTIKSQETLADAQNIAAEYDNQEIAAEHVLYALVKQQDGIVGAIIKKSAATGQEDMLFSNISKDLVSEIEKKVKVSGGNISLSRTYKDFKQFRKIGKKFERRLRFYGTYTYCNSR